MKNSNSLQVGPVQLAVSGRVVRIAAVHDEEWLSGEPLPQPEQFVDGLRDKKLRADLFRFSRALPETRVLHPYHVEWDNAAAADISDYDAWWASLPQETRKNVRRAEKRGLFTEVASFDDTLVDGIHRIYNELPVRQGRRFWHYGKPRELVRAENATYLERSIFVVARRGGRIIGFLKFVMVNRLARIMQILSLQSEVDSRPTNALLAKAMEVASQLGATHFIYGKYIYGNKVNSPMVEFKRRNGFEELRFPRYYLPLTPVGHLSLRLQLHHGILHALPEPITDVLLKGRSALFSRLFKTRKSGQDNLAS